MLRAARLQTEQQHRLAQLGHAPQARATKLSRGDDYFHRDRASGRKRPGVVPAKDGVGWRGSGVAAASAAGAASTAGAASAADAAFAAGAASAAGAAGGAVPAGRAAVEGARGVTAGGDVGDAAERARRVERRLANDRRFVDTENLRRVTGVQWGLMTSTEVEHMSHVRVRGVSGYGKQLAPPNSAMDARMGPPDIRAVPCAVCHRTMGCYGHMGSIFLPVPIYHPSFFTNTLMLLRAHCWWCHGSLLKGPLASERLREMDVTCPPTTDAVALRRLRMQYVREKPCRSKRALRTCPDCEMPQPVYEHRMGDMFVGTKWKPTDYAEVRKVLCAARTEDARLVWEADHPPPEEEGDEEEYAAACAAWAGAREEVEAPEVRDHEAEELRDEDGIIVPPDAEYLAILDDMRLPFNAARARAILRGIRPGDLARTGMRGPVESFVPDILPVMPLPFRPTGVQHNNGSTDMHDMTAKYTAMARASDALFKSATALGLDTAGGALEGDAGEGADAAAESGGGGAKKATARALREARRLAEENDAEMDTARMALGAADAHRLLADADRAALQQSIQDNFSVLVENTTRVGAAEQTHGGKDVRNIRSVLSGKTGIMREVAEGKRMNNSARATIGGDPSLRPSQVGVPCAMATTLTLPVRVTDLNVEELTQCVVRGPGVRDGATTIETADGLKLDLEYMFPTEEERRTAIVLHPGHVVHRHLRDGDVVLINRAPSLHKMSIIALHVVVLWDSRAHTLRINLSVTSPLNADFDGDDVTLIVPQSVEARTEAWELMSMQAHLLSPAKNAPCMGAVQDDLTIAHLATEPGQFLDRAEFFQALIDMGDDGPLGASWAGMAPRGSAHSAAPTPAILLPRHHALSQAENGGRAPVGLWTGHQVVSAMLGGTRALYRNNQAANDVPFQEAMMRHDVAVVRGGEMLAGTLDKKAVGVGANLGLIHSIALFCGAARAESFMVALSRGLCAWGRSLGFSVRMEDQMTREEVLARVRGDQDEMERVAERLTARGVALGVPREEVDAAVMEVVNATQANIGKRVVADAVEHGSHFMKVVRCGAKGSDANMAQKASVGPMQLDGKFIAMGHGGRLASCFAHDDTSLGARGYVRSGYMTPGGLTGVENMASHVVGRKHVVDKVASVWRTGHAQRRIMKGTEDNVARGRATVGARGRIVQLRAHGDALDPSRLMKIAAESARTTADATLDEWAARAGEGLPEMRAWRDGLRRTHTSHLWPDDGRVMLAPFSIPHVLEMVVRRGTPAARTAPAAGDDSDWELSVRPTHADVLDGVRAFCRATIRFVGEAASDAFCWYLLHWGMQRACPRSDPGVPPHDDLRVLGREWSALCEACAALTEKALVADGEAIGIVAAQSVGERLTQVIMNTVHNVRGGSSGGIVKLDEILNCSLTPKDPQMTLVLKPGMRPTPRQRSRLMTVRIDDLRKDSEFYVIEDPPLEAPPHTCKARDAAMMALDAVACPDGSEWDQAREIARRCSARRRVWEAAHEAWAERERLRIVKRHMSSSSSARSGAGGGVMEAGLEEKLAALPSARDDGEPPEPPPTPRPSDFVIRLGLNRQTCLANGLTPRLVARSLMKACTHLAPQLSTVFSDASAEAWIVRIRPWGVEGSPELAQLFAARLKDALASQVSINGVGTVTAVADDTQTRWETRPDGTVHRTVIPVIVTTGSNMRGVPLLPWANPYRSTSSDPMEMAAVFGACVGRVTSFWQLHRVLFASGGSTDRRHVMQITDNQWSAAVPLKHIRSGIATRETDALQRSSFEESWNVMTEAAALGARDEASGVTSAQFMGTRNAIGTGAVALMTPFVKVQRPLKGSAKFGQLITRPQRAQFEREELAARARGVLDADSLLEVERGGVSNLGAQRVVLPDPAAPEEDGLGAIAEEDGLGAIAEEDGLEEGGEVWMADGGMTVDPAVDPAADPRLAGGRVRWVTTCARHVVMRWNATPRNTLPPLDDDDLEGAAVVLPPVAPPLLSPEEAASAIGDLRRAKLQKEREEAERFATAEGEEPFCPSP